MRHNANTKLNEQGFASIVIALVLIVVLALLTVGFAQLARREQQNSLDKQLASQAKYAAESGINNAYRDIQNKIITTDPSSPTTVQANSSTCMTPTGASTGTHDIPRNAASFNQNINSSDGTSFTCLLVNLTPPNLSFPGVSPGTGRHMNFSTQDNLSTLTFQWGSATGRTTYAPNLPPSSQFPTNNNWPYPPVVEFSLTPVGGLASQANPTQYLVDNTFNFYAYPSKGGPNSLAFNPGNQGQVISGNCSGTGTYPCQITLTGLGGQNYVLHVIDFYDSSNIYVTGTTTTGSVATFSGEPMIDVTGKARDVLKRLQERILINGGSYGTPDDNAILPNGAIEAQNICKRFWTAPVILPDNPTGTKYDTGTSGSCDLSQ